MNFANSTQNHNEMTRTPSQQIESLIDVLKLNTCPQIKKEWPVVPQKYWGYPTELAGLTQNYNKVACQPKQPIKLKMFFSDEMSS
jgi:hypothetical protein